MFVFFFFNDTATTEIYTLSLHDALPIWALGEKDRLAARQEHESRVVEPRNPQGALAHLQSHCSGRSEEHTSELQSQSNIVCRLLLEKKKNPYPVERTI